MRRDRGGKREHVNDFTASNGVTLQRSPEGHVILPPAVMGLGEESQQALRELFDAEKDAALGRWRWPAHPDYVVYPKDEHGQTVVLNETTGHNITFLRGQVNRHGSDYAQCALAFFEAHPEPKPWHDAKQGEVWVVKTTLEWEQAEIVTPRAVTSTGKFMDVNAHHPAVEVTSPRIVEARRIFPEVSAA